MAENEVTLPLCVYLCNLSFSVPARVHVSARESFPVKLLVNYKDSKRVTSYTAL